MNKKFCCIILIGLFFLSGCRLEKEKDTSAEKLREITIGVTSFADSLEPTDQYFGWVVSRYGIGETLVRFDQQGVLQPWLAEEWFVSEDQLTWTFVIREGVKFSNGNTMSAESVKQSLERSFAMNDRSTTYFQYESIETQGNLLTIRTYVPIATIPGCLADPLFQIVDTTVDTADFAKNGPICTGPYVVENFSPSDSCVLVPNPYYWQGEPGLDRVKFLCIDDQSTRSMALQTGEIQIAYNLKTENLKEFDRLDNIDVQTLDSLRTTYAFMNQNGPLADVALRQAITLGIDRQSYTEHLLQGGASPASAPIPPTLDYDFESFADYGTYDPEKAKQILADAGYRDTNGDGFLETPDGNDLVLEFVIYTSREELSVYAQAAQANLKDIGINVTLKTVSYETLLGYRDAGTYDLLIWNVLVANTGDTENYLRENWYSTSSANTSGYQNPQVDQLLDELATVFDEEKRRSLVVDIQHLLMADAATLFFGYEKTLLFYDQSISGLEIFPMDYYWLTSDVTVNN